MVMIKYIFMLRLNDLFRETVPSAVLLGNFRFQLLGITVLGDTHRVVEILTRYGFWVSFRA